MTAAKSFFSPSSVIFCSSRLNSLHDARQLFVRIQRVDAEAAANLRGAEIDGADGPGLGHHLQDGRADGRRAGVAGLELVQAAIQLLGKAGRVHAEMFEQKSGIARAGIQQLAQIMLDFDVVMGA